MVVAAMFLVEKFIVQLISVSYHRKQFNARIRESKRTIRILDLMYDASRRLFPSFCPEFAEEDYLIHDTVSVPGGGSLSGPGSGLRFLGDIGRFGDKVTAAFGNMASEITGKEVFNATSAHSIVTVALERKAASEALAKRLWVSFVGEGQQELYEQDIIDILGADRESEARDIFSALDRDGNGDVSLEEMIMLVVEIGQNRKAIARSMHDISSAIAVLDNIFLFIMTIAIALIYGMSLRLPRPMTTCSLTWCSLLLQQHARKQLESLVDRLHRSVICSWRHHHRVPVMLFLPLCQAPIRRVRPH